MCLEELKFVADSSEILLQRSVLNVFLIFSLSEAVKNVLPLKRNLAERLGKKIEILENADKAPKRGTTAGRLDLMHRFPI